MFKMWIGITAFVFLGICSVFDCVKKEIPLALIWIGILTAVLLRMKGAMGDTQWLPLVLSVMPGLCFFLLSFLTGEKVGYGDGWLLIMIGLFVGFESCFLILLLGLIAESAVVLALMSLKKIQRDGEVPFAPFLLIGMGVVLWV